LIQNQYQEKKLRYNYFTRDSRMLRAF